jgi:DNA repair protein RecO (recombination protein O)
VPEHVSESLVLRTYPLKESDLIVSFFTRDQGKVRGVANRARRLKSGFGAGLERLSHVRMSYYQRENRDLVRIDSSELIRAHMSSSSYEHTVALDFIAEVSELLLPPLEVNEKFFRLMLAVVTDVEASSAQSLWKGLTYFVLWAVKLQGFLPYIQISEQSRELGMQMIAHPVSEVTGEGWTKATAADLRRALVRLIEEHTERRLITASYLEAL